MADLSELCPSCGAKVKLGSNQRTVTCSYCGTRFSVNNQETDESVGSDLIISALPLTYHATAKNVDELVKETKSKIINWGKNFKEVVENGTIKKSRMFGVPYIRFEIEYNAKCFCQIGKEKISYVKVERGDRTVQEKKVDLEYEPWEGVRDGTYTDDILVGKPNSLVDEEDLSKVLSFIKKANNGTAYLEEGWEEDDNIQTQYKALLDPKIGQLSVNDFWGRYLKGKLERHIDSEMPSPSRNNYSEYQYQIKDITAIQADYFIEEYHNSDSSLAVVISLSTGKYDWWWNKSPPPQALAVDQE